MKRKTSIIQWTILILVSSYSFFEIIKLPTNNTNGLFGYSSQRILLLVFPILSLLVCAGLLVGSIFFFDTYRRKLLKIGLFTSSILQYIIAISFWVTFLLGSAILYFLLILSFKRETATEIFGINNITFFSYADRIWGILILFFVWTLFLFYWSYRNKYQEYGLDYYIFFHFIEYKKLFRVFFFIMLIFNMYNLFWLHYVTDHSFGVDFGIYFNAYKKAINGGNPYVPYSIGVGFINHPFILSFISLITNKLKEQTYTSIIWLLLSFISWIVTLEINLSFIKDQSTRKNFFYLFLITFGPFYEMLFLGQVNAFVILFISLFYYYRDKEWGAGFFLAVAIVLKTSPLIFLAFLFVTKKWKAIVSCLLSVAALSVIPMLQFRYSLIFDFITSISKVGFEVHTLYYNESIVSLLYQLLDSYTSVDLAEIGTRIITSGLLIVIIGLLSFVHFFKQNKEYEYLLFICFNLVMVIFSPLVWYHHLVFMIIPLIGLYVYPVAKNRSGLAIIISILLIQLQRIVEIISKPGFPTIIVSIFMLCYFLYLYFSNTKLEVQDIKNFFHHKLGGSEPDQRLKKC